MNVQSALGQPLRAEVELIDAKSSNLRAGMAPATVYAQKGLDYGQTVKSIRASVRKMPNGRAVLVLTSDAPINDPFVDVVLHASDGTGSVTRDFSLLLDPPSAPAPVAVVEPATPRAPAAAKAPRSERMVLPPVEGEEIDVAPTRPSRKKATASRGRMRSGAVRVPESLQPCGHAPRVMHPCPGCLAACLPPNQLCSHALAPRQPRMRRLARLARQAMAF